MSAFSKIESALHLALLRAFKCGCCPVCGRAKQEKQCFCKTCYFALENALRNLLYTKIDASGQFEDHYLKAIRDLKRRGMARPLNRWTDTARRIIEDTGLAEAMKEYIGEELQTL